MSVTILASRYNTLRNNVNLVLGTSVSASEQYGYGQGFSTNSVVGTRSVSNPVDANKVTAQDYEDLYIDLIRVRSHQVGASVAISEFVVGDYDTNTVDTDLIEESYVLSLESLASNIITDKFAVDPSNLIVANLPAVNSTRAAATGSWNGTISHIFTVTFNTDTERRHFFNAGGEIRFSASVDYTGSQAKTVDWQTILNAMTTISFKATETINNAAIGTSSSIGNYDLTTSYQLVYSRDGGAVYANNEYRIFAREVVTIGDTSTIQFKVEFVDGTPNDPTWGIDEPVSGTFNSVVQTATPSSQITINGTVHDAVIIETPPTGTNIRILS
jgi:hypothetical protein